MDFEAISDTNDAEQSDRGMSEKIAVVALNPEFIAEQAHIFRNAWVPVCHESELPEPYDFRTASIGSENIIICRAPDGKINALLNVCPHRGMLIERRPQGSFLEGQASGNPKRITCMFHAWQFDMRGNCVYVAREKEGYQERFSKDDAGLRRLRCTVNFGGFVWVNMTDQPVAMLEESAGPAMQTIENQISAVPLEVVHYHKEYVETGYQAEALQYLNAAKAGSVFDYGHCVITGSDLGSEKQDASARFPDPNSQRVTCVHLFPGYRFELSGPVLNVSVVTPVDKNRIMIEHRGLVPQTESQADREMRAKYYNLSHGPFKTPTTVSEEQSEKSLLSEHYLEEWSMWMGTHPEGLSRINEKSVADQDSDQETNKALTGPHIVVIGASHAGISIADRLRKNGFIGNISIFDRQVGGPMERPPLSKGFLLGGGETVESKSLLRQKKWYKANKVKLKTQSVVHKINRNNKTITVNNGDVVKYDKLVIASGAVPKELPSSKGIGNAFVLRQPADANAIRQAANNSDSVVIIGGGYIGLEVAASLRKKGMDITVIEAGERILARVASKPLAEYLNKLHEDNGVTVITNVGVEGINQEAGIFNNVTLSDGRVIKGDMLITGIGVYPDSQLASDAGLETQFDTGGAILVDNDMRTSDEDIFAIGDVAIRREQTIAVESVHNAQETAAIAAASITGANRPNTQTPWFWSDQYDAKLQSVGIVPVQDESVYQVERLGKREGAVSFWSYRGDELVAVEVVNDPATYMEARQCLDTGRFPDPKQIGKPSYSPVDSGGSRS